MAARFGRKMKLNDIEISLPSMISILADEIFELQAIGWPRAISQFGIPYVSYRAGEELSYSAVEANPPIVGEKVQLERVRRLFEHLREGGNDCIVWRRLPHLDGFGLVQFRCHTIARAAPLAPIPPAD